MSGENWWSVIARRPSTNRAHRKGAGRVPCGKLPGSVRWTGAPHGARLGPGRGPHGARPASGRVPCGALFSSSDVRASCIRCRREGAARAILYIKQTPDGRRPMLYIAPGTLEGPLRRPQDSRAAPLTTARRPSIFFHENWQEKSCGTRPATGRSPHGTPRVQSRAFYGLTVRWKRRENREQPAQHRGAPRRPYGWWKMSRCPWEPRGSRPGTVRNWPKCLFLLAVRAPEWICDLGFKRARDPCRKGLRGRDVRGRT